jgi:hypothetical protein
MRCTLALIFTLTTAATAQAGWFNGLGRHLGLGWSDGYHAAGPSPPHSFSSFAIPPGGLASPEQIVVPSGKPTPAKMPHSLPPPRSAQPLFELPQ